MTATGLPLQLLRLVSPSLPVGAFSYSRGLEWAVQAGWVKDEAGARDWILGTLEQSYAALDAPLFWRMMQALQRDDTEAFGACDAWLAASRESREIQLEDRRMAEGLCRLLKDLGLSSPWVEPGRLSSYPAAFALAASHWKVAPEAALLGLMWTVVEGQAAAAVRLVPLGQTAAQRILVASADVITRSAAKARALEDDEIGNVSHRLAMASAWHETQYSRLFQS